MLNSTHPIAGATTNSRSCPLLSLAASAIAATSAAAACGGAAMSPAKPPRPNPMTSPLVLRMRLIWLSAGCRMLNSTHPMAGIMGSSRARPRLSPSAMSAICCAANAASQVPRAVNMAPATAVGTERLLVSGEAIRPLGRERREGFEGVSLVGNFGDVGLRHLALIMAIADIVAAIVELRVVVRVEEERWGTWV
ncbi:hypothetical protein V8G54_004742 [Vigna mungo]|uniref:Uncharacterized protein n=1 Tax=Vigna mungo TaxID=3915 RepID=A0AAQ3PHC6_VIGMU